MVFFSIFAGDLSLLARLFLLSLFEAPLTNDLLQQNHITMSIKPVIEPESKLPMKSARAAYANLARLNLFNTLAFIEDVIGLKDPGRKEDSIGKMTILSLNNTPKNAEFRQKAFRLFCRHFGFLKYMNEEDEKRKTKGNDYIKTMDYDTATGILKRIVDVLVYYRDQSTHHAFRDERTSDDKFLAQEELLAWELDTCFTIAIRIIKERFSKEFKKSKNEKTCLDFLNGRTYKDKYTNETLLNHQHPYSLSRKENGSIRLNELGKVYLLSLFLQKQYASELLDKCRIFEERDKNSRLYAGPGSTQQSYVRDIFSALRIRLPQDRLDTTIGIKQIGMDMLGELKRCPGELFDLLSADDQQRFRTKDTNTGTEVLFKRFSDRFPQLALSYIDYAGLFRCARFAVNMGKYRYVFKEKKLCIDGNTEPRILQKDLNGFGRIQEIEALRTMAPDAPDNPWPYQKLIKGYEDTPRKDADCCPYIQDTRTRYLFNRDRIGIAFGPKPDDYPSEYASSLKKDGHHIWYLPEIKECEGEDKHAVVQCIEPHCWLSIYDIPAMTFLAFLTRDNVYYRLQLVEKVILDCVIRYRKLFKDIAEGTVFNTAGKSIEEHVSSSYDIPFKDIPKNLQRFLKKEGYDARERFRTHLLRIVKGDAEMGVVGMKELSDRRLKQWEKDKKTVKDVKNNKAGKEGFIEIKVGKLMSWLLKDIVMFQKYMPVTDESGITRSNKLTSLNYAKLQALLSAFPFQKTEDLVALLKKYGIWETHPFLKDSFLDAYDALIAPDPFILYENYLNDRSAFLKSVIEILEAGHVPINYGFVKAERRKWQKDYLETLPQEFYNKVTGRFIPIFLPSGLFEKPLREQLERIPEMRDALVAGDKSRRKANATYMIQKYFEVVLGDGSQPYYSFERTYSFHEYIDKKRKEICTNAIPAKDNATGRVLPTSNFREAVKEALATRPVINKQNNNRIRPGEENTPPTPFSVDTLRKKWNDMSDTERTLRRYKVQDMILFLLGTSIVFPADCQTRHSDEGFLLKNIMGGIEGKDILSQPVDITTTVRINKKGYSVEQKGVKVKDYTEVFALLRDTRTRSLLPILPEGPVNADDLRDELKRYDQQRPVVFQDILIFEKSQYDRFRGQLEEGRIDFLKLLSFEAGFTPLEETQLRAIRNAFSHNIYALPEAAGYTPALRPAPENGPAESLEKKANDIVNKRRP